MAREVPGYEPLARLGRGSTGMVMSARDATTGTAVAIKYLAPALASDGFRERYRADVAVLDRIEHPNVAQIYEFVEADDSAAVVTELVEGASLRRVLAAGPLEPEAALVVLQDALLGLGEAHGRGIAHRDVKPENLIIASAGVVKVVDFGIAARARRVPVEGDPRYLAPELWAGGSASAASDVYAATAVLLECLTGRAPRPRSGRPVTDAIRGLPDEIQALLVDGLAADPGQRPADADAMLERLDRAALAAYGAAWEDVGRATLRWRLNTGRSERRQHAARGTGLLAGARWRLLAAGAAVLAVSVAAVAVVTGALATGGSPTVVPTMSHVPIVVPGPTVPVPTSTGPAADTVAPDRPTGLRITGRSQTAVSLTWNPAPEAAGVAGYLVTRDGRPAGTSYGPGFTDTGLTPKTRYEYAVTAFDAAGNRSPATPTVTATTLTEPDVSPPSVPTGLHLTGRSTTTIVLAWSPSTDNVGVAGYEVYRDGVVIANAVMTNFTDTGLAPASTHTYALRAYDTANNASASSPSISVATLQAPDTTKPSAPTGLSATPTGVSTIALAWTAATDNVGVVAYRIVRDGGQVATTASPGYLDEGLAAATSYTYTVIAVDAAGNASAPSGPATATTDAPPPPPPPPPTTPPAATVTGLSITTSTIVAPGCTTTITASVTATGALTADLTYTIGGSGGTVQVVFSDAGTQLVTLGTGDGHADGSASVSTPGPPAATTGWSAPAECLPPPPTTDPPSPTE